MSSSKPLGLLTIGNVVNASLRLYSSNFWRFFRLSLFAHLWILIPIYGWAKYSSEAGLISRLCFGELIGQPESNTAARNQISKKFWSFLLLALNIDIFIFLVFLGFCAVIVAIVFAVASFLSNAGILAGVFMGLLITGSFIATIFLIVRLVSRWFVAEMPLAIETGFNVSRSMERSWQLTESSVNRIQGIVLVAFLVTIPIQGVSGIPQFALLAFEPGTSTYWVVYGITILFSLGGGAVVMPFWQAIKAVIYYDLRNRREGVDLQLRDRT